MTNTRTFHFVGVPWVDRFQSKQYVMNVEGYTPEPAFKVSPPLSVYLSLQTFGKINY